MTVLRLLAFLVLFGIVAGGGAMDPNGSPAAATGDEGNGFDPHG